DRAEGGPGAEGERQGAGTADHAEPAGDPVADPAPPVVRRVDHVSDPADDAEHAAGAAEVSADRAQPAQQSDRVVDYARADEGLRRSGRIPERVHRCTEREQAPSLLERLPGGASGPRDLEDRLGHRVDGVREEVREEVVEGSVAPPGAAAGTVTADA